MFKQLLEAADKQLLFKLQQDYIDALDDAWDVQIVPSIARHELNLTRPGKLNGHTGVLVISDPEGLELHSTLDYLNSSRGVNVTVSSVDKLQKLTLAVCRATDLGVALSKTKKVSGFTITQLTECINVSFDHWKFGSVSCTLDDDLKWEVIVQGYKADMSGGDKMSDQDVLEFVTKVLTLKWMREHDDHGSKW